MRRRQGQGHRLVGAVLALVLFAAFPAFIIVGAQSCADDKLGALCAAVKFVLEDAASTVRVTKTKLAQ
jgi:hypothetical protein